MLDGEMKLVVASGEAAGPVALSPDDEVSRRLVTAGCAIEMIHTFSLIHDDLPALDDDNLRRGRPTVHVQFDEATAVLAGDALLNGAYEVLCSLSSPSDGAVSLRAIAAVARGVGLSGMISGQVLDLESENNTVDDGTLHRIHALKTGALIRVSCEIGGIVAGASDISIEHLGDYGRHLGLAFQIVDDILDVEGSASDLGKSPGKDARANKATFPAMWGTAESRRRAAECVEKACGAVAPLGDRAEPLVNMARAILTRRR